MWLVVLRNTGIQWAVFHCHCAQLSLRVSSSCRNFVMHRFLVFPFLSCALAVLSAAQTDTYIPGICMDPKYFEWESFGLHVLVICSQLNTQKTAATSVWSFLQSSPHTRAGCYILCYYVVEQVSWKSSFCLTPPFNLLGLAVTSQRFRLSLLCCAPDPHPWEQASSQSLQQAADTTENCHLVLFPSPTHLQLRSNFSKQQNPYNSAGHFLFMALFAVFWPYSALMLFFKEI